ncbi:DNA polymerase III subunit gamma and tau [Agromyces humatus]|uniref:DNA polymerase III subunit gamma/tau n=1 Tax=Agromyces humatus TaxID=279573 RepID=A0ABP4WER1_9MICO|nr:DNA polymerase III subunit gamma and tau [Agromyces humatus]
MVTALYRRYRPETFAEMIGQSQVTEPLMTALRTDRVNHAYLFSGPRGCGKTTSARILARCLNCVEGPTDAPCGVCPSCVELSRGGGGSLDVVEIDAASHGGVDDARDLRERAIFAPARDRYKIFIIDEAHMVTSGGFNALLKIVEEPPEHVKFIFATTEPDKVLGTIRSRTHHYPFRLVPPAPMLEYVQQLCAEEGITVEPGVLALVVRAGGGSPRDTLSLLDQLMAGSEGTTIDYERAVALLGYTHGALLDEVVDAIGARDAAGAFAAADRVVQTGQDPRRFVEDLLERLRDLIVVAASSPAAAAAVLRGVPEDELARMAVQAGAFGSAELSRVADLVNQTLTEMTGATSPRLHLELMLARVLVPGADDTERGALARVEQLERRVAGGEFAAGRAATPDAGRAAAERPAGEPAASTTRPAGEPAAPTPRPAGEPAAAPTPRPAGEPAAPTPRPAPARSVGPVTLQQIRDAWPEVLAALQRTKRTAWMAALSAQVLEYRTEGDVLVLGFTSPSEVQGLRAGTGSQNSAELLRTAIHDVLGVTVKFLPRVIGANATPSPGADESAGAPQASAPLAGGGPERAPAAAAPRAPGSDSASPAPGSDSASSVPRASSQPVDPPAQTAPAPITPAGPVDSWATVAIPTDPVPEAEAGAVSHARTTTMVAERATVPDAADDAPPFDESAAPPEDIEPPFDPGPEPEVVAEASVPTSAPAAATKTATSKRRRAPAAPAATDGGIQRYGEAVVREVLGATFIEETEAPPARAGFGERG